MNRLEVSLPSLREILVVCLCLGIFLLVTAVFIGLRPEHVIMAVVYLALFTVSASTRKFAVAILPFVIFGISYDWMKLLPNYEVNSIDVKGLYDLEKTLFGIHVDGRVLIPGEYFTLHHCQVADFFAGIFYLCWVPVPVLFGVYLYIIKRRDIYLPLAMVFLLVNLIGFTGYYIHPAAPPWYAIHYGFVPELHTPGNTAGLGRFDAMFHIHLFEGIYGRNSNVFAAVPSLHAAYMVVPVFYALKAKCPKWLVGLFIVIMAGIWCTAVYTTHHYIIDVLLGIMCACLSLIIFERGLMRLPSFVRFFKSYLAYIS